MVLQLGAGQSDVDYKEIRDKVVSVAGNKEQMVTRVPMDIGQVGKVNGLGMTQAIGSAEMKIKNLVRMAVVEVR